MKLEGIASYRENRISSFKGRRVDRNVVSQLIKNNPYSLTEPNQRYISQAIESLGKIKGARNIKFLLNTAAKNTYSTSIKLQDAPKNDWKSKLIAAATAAAAITPFISKSLLAKIEKAKEEQALNKDEKDILALRDQLLSVVDLEQINSSFKGTMKDFQKNLDYFVISSETTLEHKKYVLERLNYFMSDEYEINPQLKDKKSIVVAEMINDMAINVPGNKTPNIKAVNQKQHGMCAAICIVRKKLAYEDKPNYVDAILSELDSKDVIMVYDRSRLGSKKRVPVTKIPVDFETAINNGYRIIDASTMHWMQIATMTGASNISYKKYTPFDKENFDTRTDTFFNLGFENEELQKTHEYYQSLMAAKNVIGEYKARHLKESETKQKNRLAEREDIETLAEINSTLRKKFSELDITNPKELVVNLFNLEFSHSDKIPQGNKYAYIPNEEKNIKKEKIRNFIIDNTELTSIDEKTLNSIFELIEMHSEIRNKETSSNLNKKINRAKELYEVASAYRSQIVKGLEDTKTLENMMINEKIVDRENLLLNTIQILGYELQSNSQYSDDIIRTLSPLVEEEVENPTKEDILAFLGGLEEMVLTILDQNIEYHYASLGFTEGSRGAIKSALLGMQDLASTGNKKDVEDLAHTLQCKKDRKAIVEKINELIYIVSTGEVSDVEKISMMLGNTSQLKTLAEAYVTFINEVKNVPAGQYNEVLENFLEANEIDPNDQEAIDNKLESIRAEINAAATFIDLYTKGLKVYDKNGLLIVSPDPKDVILDKLEKTNKIPSEKAMKELQEHLTKITKDRSTDEFQSRRSGKLKDKSLYEFSKTEEKTLKDIEDSINTMYSYVEKELNKIYPTIRTILENHNREIGLENGSYWNMEGGSGLYRNQQVRILEYMTGRPHYATENLKEAIDKIKVSPYSGITSSSVFHDKPGFHAQYIADIEPVTVQVKDKDGNIRTEKREILYQDNSWGPSEAENTWVDSEGNLRTDYSDNRGGNLGYITNNQMRNGNYVDRILGDMILRTKPDTTEGRTYKKITHSKDGHTWAMPQYNEIIIEGNSPKLRFLAGKIHDTILIPTSRLVKKLEEKLSGGNFLEVIGQGLNGVSKKKMAKIMEEYQRDEQGYTLEQLEEMIEKVKKAGNAWKIEYKALQKRIFDPFNPEKVTTEEEYNNLADNDPLKVVMEKIALEKRYPIYGLEANFARIKDIKDFKRYSDAQHHRAIENFKYAFNKNIEIINHLAESFKLEEDKALEKIYKKYNLNLTDEAKDEITTMFSIEEDDFNGSLEKTISLIMSDLSEVIDKHIKHSMANKEVKNYFETFLKEHSYFSQTDLKEEKIKHIIDFIDRVYDPEDDKEFVKIYRSLQNMTTEEFEKEILSKVNDKDLGFKEKTGYDILKEIQRHNEEYEREMMNTIYYANFASDLTTHKTDPAHKLKKFYKDTVYTMDHSFDDMYLEISNDLFLLTLPKLFNKWKDYNYRLHGAFTAYPKVNLVSKENVIDYSFGIVSSTIKQCVSESKQIKNQLESYELIHNLNKFVENFTSDYVLTEEDFITLNNYLGEFVTRNFADDSIGKAINSALNLLEIPKGSTWSEYENEYNILKKKMADVENSAKPEALEKLILELQEAISSTTQQFCLTVQNRYKGNIQRKLNELTQAYIKDNHTKIESISEEILKDYEKYQLLNNPEELLDSYIKSHAIDYVDKQKGRSADDKNIYKTYLKRSLNFAYLADIQEIIMDAIDNATAVKAKDGFKDYPIGFNGEDFVNMGSDETIVALVDSLFIENDKETAMMFIDKLGLGEPYIRFLTKNINLEKLEQSIRRNSENFFNFEKFKQALTPEIYTAKTLLDNNDSDYITILNELRKSTVNLAEKYPIDKKEIKKILKAIDESLIAFENNENIDKAFLFKSIIETALASVESSIYKHLENFSKSLEETQGIIHIMNEIMLPEDCDAHAKRVEFTLKYNEVMNKLVEETNLQVIN